MLCESVLNLQQPCRISYLLCFTLSLALVAPAMANDFTRWQSIPAKSNPVSVTSDAVTIQSGAWSYLYSPMDLENIEISATLLIESPASQFEFFGSSWSAWPDPKFEDRGFEAGMILRGSADGSSGYRIQLSSKYQELAIVRFPESGYVRSVPCQIKTGTPVKLRVQATGPIIRVFIDGQQCVQYVDRLGRQLAAGRLAVGASSGSHVTWTDYCYREITAEPAPPAEPHRLRLTHRKWLGGRTFVFDDNEPILQLHDEQDPSMFAKLRPAFKPLLTFDSHWGLENQGAYKEAMVTWTSPQVVGGGEALTATWSARHVKERFATSSSLAVGYDSSRNCYTYDIASELTVLPGEPFEFRYGFDFEHHTPLDPFRWQYLLIRNGEGTMTYRPLSPFDPGTFGDVQLDHGLRVWHGRTGDEHVISPAVEYQIQPEWIELQNSKVNKSQRKLNTAVCAAFYDTGVAFESITANPGDKIRVQYRYTGYSSGETSELFASARVQDNPRIDPQHHFLFVRDQWPTIRFDDALAMDKPWWGGRPLMSGHNLRPTYDLVKQGGQGLLRLGPVSYAAAAVGPEKIEPGRYVVSAKIKSKNTHGPGGRIELLLLKKADLHGNSYVRWDVANIGTEQTRYFGNGSFDWRDVFFTVDIPSGIAGLAIGLGNGGTGEVLVSEVRIEPHDDRQVKADELSSEAPTCHTVQDAVWDLRMQERQGLFVYNHGVSSHRVLELANVDWVEDFGRAAIKFRENPNGRRDFPVLGILDRNLRNPAQRQNYEQVSHGAFGLAGGPYQQIGPFSGITLAARIKAAAEMGNSASYGGKGDIVGFGARRFILGLHGQTAPYSLVARVNVNDTIESNAKLDADCWYHVAMTCTVSGEKWWVRLYLDGREVGSGISKSLPVSSSFPDSLVLGAELFYLHGAFYRGLMTDVLVVGRSLDANEIASIARLQTIP